MSCCRDWLSRKGYTETRRNRTSLGSALEGFGTGVRITRRSFDLILRRKARDGFDGRRKSDKVRERYGRTTFGQTVYGAAAVEAGNALRVQVPLAGGG